jgi:endonuclease/exonuclease/phosphatase family metal-dependent hydrolase
MEYSASRIEGLGFISRLPIQATHFNYLPPAIGDRNRRIVYHAIVEHDNGPVDIFNCHITYDVRSQDD